MSPTFIRQDVINFTEASLVRWLAKHDIAPYRAGQIRRWTYHRGACSVSDMTDLSKDLRGLLSERLDITISNLKDEEGWEHQLILYSDRTGQVHRCERVSGSQVTLEDVDAVTCELRRLEAGRAASRRVLQEGRAAIGKDD